MFDLLLAILREYGIFAAVTLWFIYRDSKREDSMNLKIQILETERREIIIPLVERSTNVIALNTAVMADTHKMMERWERTMGSR